jgi:glutathione S-transferase
MSRTLHYGSGSPFAWKIWLALEHKQLPYDLKVIQFDRGDHKLPEFLQLNPRGKVPVLVDGDHVLWESSAILEYLEEKYPERPLLPGAPEARAHQRRLVSEADAYLYAAQRDLMRATLYTPESERDPAKIAAAGDAVIAELERFAGYLRADYFGGADISFADVTIYPYLRLIKRVEDRLPDTAILRRFPAAITDYMRRFATLPYVEKTTPPHWR